MTGTVSIPGRMNGPPSSANGGIACGIAALELDVPARARLHRPVSLDTPLEVVRDGDEVRLLEGEDVVASAAPCAPVELEPPLWPTLDEARAAATNRVPRDAQYALFDDCWVCSAHRRDGLGALFGPVAADPAVNAGVVEPGDPSVWDADGRLSELALWGALDCPSYVPVLWSRPQPALLAQLAARIDVRPSYDDRLICLGWHLRSEGRKHYSASALMTAGGELCGVAEALWIELRAPE